MPQMQRPAPAATGNGADTFHDGNIRENIPSPLGVQAGSHLRDYQLQVLDDVDAEWAAGRRRVLIQAATGAGKTVIAAEAIRRARRDDKRVLFIAHRRELISQASQKLYAAGIDHGIVQAGFPPRLGEHVQVASIATLHARAVRSRVMDLPDADLIVVDEAHHVRAESYRKIIEAYPDAIVIGLTATPCRADGRGLGAAFEVIVSCPPVADLITRGYLVQSRIYAPSEPDLAGITVARGDYVEREVAERVDHAKLIGDIVTHWHRLGERRRTVVFACGVQHSLHVRDEFRRAGVMADHIDGATPTEERDRILAQLASGSVDVVCNAMVLTEGWDCPEVGCLILARPTRNLGLYRQMVGRVLRPAPGKVEAIILDHSGAVFQHGLPDDPIEWTLAEDRRAVNKAHASRGQKLGVGLAKCPECAALRLRGQPCESCGWKPRERAEGVEIVDGDLQQVDRGGRHAVLIDRRAFHAGLAWIAREKGYASGWAAHKFKEKFGTWPTDRWVTPEPPTDEIRSWVRSRQIAYAKAMAKQRGAA